MAYDQMAPMTRRLTLCGLVTLLGFCALPVSADSPKDFVFASIDGGELDLAEWHGRPVLVVNTASRCGFTHQYEALQSLYDRYRDRGLVVLAVPSNDFRQELATAQEVKDFCEINFGLDLPMADITPVLGQRAHPFYRWVYKVHGFEPDWNFNKILLSKGGNPIATFGSRTPPLSRAITRQIEALLEE